MRAGQLAGRSVGRVETQIGRELPAGAADFEEAVADDHQREEAPDQREAGAESGFDQIERHGQNPSRHGRVVPCPGAVAFRA